MDVTPENLGFEFPSMSSVSVSLDAFTNEGISGERQGVTFEILNHSRETIPVLDGHIGLFFQDSW